MRKLGWIVGSKWFFWSVLSLGAALRFYWAFAFDPNPVNDGKWYLGRSTEIAAGLGYIAEGQPTAYWPVGYPALLGLAFKFFGVELLAMRLLQALLGVLCLFATHQIALVACNSVLAARAALLLLAVYPTDIAYTSLMLSEPSYNAWMMAGTAVGLSQLPRWPRTLLAGALFALAALTKPQGLLLPVLLGLFGPAPPGLRARGSQLATLVLATSLALSPWWIRNAYAFGAFVPVSNNGGINLFIGNNPGSRGGYHTLNEKVVRGGRDEYASDCRFAAKGRDYVLAHPGRTVRLWPRKLTKLLASDEAPFAWSRSMAEDKRAFIQRFVGPNELFYRGLLAAALVGCALAFVPRKLRLHRMPLRGLVLGQVLSVIAITLVYFGQNRYHHALMPWLAIFAGYLLACAAAPRLHEPGHSDVAPP